LSASGEQLRKPGGCTCGERLRRAAAGRLARLQGGWQLRRGERLQGGWRGCRAAGRAAGAAAGRLAGRLARLQGGWQAAARRAAAGRLRRAASVQKKRPDKMSGR